MKVEQASENIGKIVAKGVAVSGFGNFLLRFIDLAIAVLLLRWLTIFEYGVYRLALAAYDFAAGFFLVGLENVVVNDASAALKKNRGEAQTIISVYVFFVASVALLLFLIFLFGGEALEQWVGVGAKYIHILAILVIFEPLGAFYRIVFGVFLDFGWLTFHRIMRDITRIAALGAFFLAGGAGISGALWSLIASAAATSLIALSFYRRGVILIIPSYKEIKVALRALFLKHGKWALLDDFVSNSGRNIRPFIIKTFVGIEAVALISVAQNLISYTTSLFPIRDVLLPLFPRLTNDPAELKKHINRALKYSILAHLLLAAAAAACVPLFVRLFFPKYLPSLPFFYLLLFGLPWTGFRSVLLPVFYALKEQRILFRLTVGRILFVTFAGVTLTYFFGIWGAAFELLFVGIVITPPMVYALHRLIPSWRLNFRELFYFDASDREVIAKLKKRILAKKEELLRGF